jgi:hypothetical protein
MKDAMKKTMFNCVGGVLLGLLHVVAPVATGQVCPAPTSMATLPEFSGTFLIFPGSGLTVQAGSSQITEARVLRVIGTGHRYRVSSCNAASDDTLLAVTRVCASPWLGSVIAVNDDACGAQSTLEFDARSGVEYNIVVGWYAGVASPTGYGLSITRLAAVAGVADPNSTCSGAIPLLVNDSRGNELVVSSSQPQGNWYSLSIPNRTTVTLQACAATGDPLIEIFDACGGLVVASNDDAPNSCSAPYGSIRASRLVAVLDGGSYLVRAGSYQGARTTGVLTATVALPPGVLTYQGKLNDQGAEANGVFDLRFNFYTSPTSTALRGTYTATGVDVTDGLFTVEIPHLSLPNVTFEVDRFMEIAARRSDQATFSVLTPRQEIGVAPVARVALNAPAGPQGPQGTPGAAGAAGPAGASPFTLSGENAVYTAGNVGIGTSTANAKLRVLGVDAGTGHSLNVSNLLYAMPSFVGVGRSTPVTGSEIFGIGSTQTGYAGMYISTPTGGQPFYGYVSGTNTAWTYLDSLSTWRLYNTAAGEIFAIASNGNTGIKVSPNATFALDVGGSIRCTTLTQTSSARFKDHVTDLARGLEDLMKVRTVEFEWNLLSPEDVRTKHDLGVIAEELAAVLPEAVARDAQGTPVGVDYSRLTVLSIKSIQELRAINQAQRQHLADLEERLAKLERAATK